MTHVNTSVHKYKYSFDSLKDRLDTKILRHFNLQLSQKLQLSSPATRIPNLVAQMKFLVALGKWAAVNVDPCLTIKNCQRLQLQSKI